MSKRNIITCIVLIAILSAGIAAAVYYLYADVPRYPWSEKNVARLEASSKTEVATEDTVKVEVVAAETPKEEPQQAQEQNVQEQKVQEVKAEAKPAKVEVQVPAGPFAVKNIATGKTAYIEPAEVVQANNRIRELEAEERREVIRILTEFTDEVRPQIPEILESYSFLAEIDFIRAKALTAITMDAIRPELCDHPHIDWVEAEHPLLRITLAKHGKKVVPLDIQLSREQRILIISGPNAGGKSVCLKTVGLLQYMLQCGMLIPVKRASRAGIFRSIFIDIGDEQSIEDDLSTYSSHLLNMKNMMREADGRSLILIDEFGSGTEPLIGGAMAEAVLRRFNDKHAYGVITTHYSNLKQFAESHRLEEEIMAQFKALKFNE